MRSAFAGEMEIAVKSNAARIVILDNVIMTSDPFP
jgi:hypothetical protein